MSLPRFPRPTRDTLSGGYLNGILSNTGAKATDLARASWTTDNFVFPLEDAEVKILSKEISL